MSNTAELIQEVYIDPIKSVLFIDDKFPTYRRQFRGLGQSKPCLMAIL